MKKRIAGYCALCRAKEMDLYGTVLNTAGKKHVYACKKAGCKHPPFYQFDVTVRPSRTNFGSGSDDR